MMTFRKLVKPEDLNPANKLFGGQIMSWADEAAAMYAMCQMKTQSIVTLKVSEILFKKPAFSGNILEFYCSNEKIGNTSLTVGLEVRRKYIGQYISDTGDGDIILKCSFVFVAVDENGEPVPHHCERPK